MDRLQVLIEALRSGQYQQGTGYLCKDGKFCVLGVLCELHDIPFDGDSYHFDTPYRSSVPDWFLEQNGLSVEDGEVLISENDEGTSFVELASMLEQI